MTTQTSPQPDDKTFADDISLCKSCYCLTHTIIRTGKCGKCGAQKELYKKQLELDSTQALPYSNYTENELDEILYKFAHEVGLEALKENMSAIKFEFSAQKAKAAIQRYTTEAVLKELKRAWNSPWREMLDRISELEQMLKDTL